MGEDEQHGSGEARHRAARPPGVLSGRLARWVHDGPLARPGAKRRYLTIVLVLAVLCGLPGIISAWPVSARQVSASDFLARIRASEPIPYSGLASSSANLALPNVGLGNQVTELLTGTARIRVWWLGPNAYRADQQTLDGEYDTYRNGRVMWSWDSSTRVALRSTRPPDFGPFPTGVDALPGPMARRLLSQAKPEQLTVGDSARIAGHATRLLTWKPDDDRSLVGEVRVWADPATGFPYGVEIRAVGGKARAYSTSFLDVSLATPSRASVTFDPSRDPSSYPSDDNGGGSPIFGPVDLPRRLGGLPLRSEVRTLFGTYGEGASVVAISVSSAANIQTLQSNIDSPGRPQIEGAFGKGTLISTSLITGLIFRSKGAGYVLIGTVTRAQLEKMALELVENPPDRVDAIDGIGGDAGS